MASGRVTVTAEVAEQVLTVANRMAVRTEQEQSALQNLADKLDMQVGGEVHGQRVRLSHQMRTKGPIG